MHPKQTRASQKEKLWREICFRRLDVMQKPSSRFCRRVGTRVFHISASLTRGRWPKVNVARKKLVSRGRITVLKYLLLHLFFKICRTWISLKVQLVGCRGSQYLLCFHLCIITLNERNVVFVTLALSPLNLHWKWVFFHRVRHFASPCFYRDKANTGSYITIT